MGKRQGKEMRGGRALGFALAIVGLMPSPSLGGTLASPGCLAGGEPATVTEVSAALELRLADGRLIMLPGIDPVRATPSRPDAASGAQDRLSHWLAEQTVIVLPLQGDVDRWGRTRALIFADPPDAGSPTGEVSVAEALLDAGLARARPDPLIAPCWTAYRAVEAAARRDGLGLWADPRYAVIRADDPGRLAEATGALAIVEGTVAAVRPGRGRTYVALDNAGFALTVERGLALRLARQGTDLASWRGKRLRVRGFLDNRFGLQIDLTSRDQVEFIDP